MKKALRMIALALVGGLLLTSLAGCGGGGDATTDGGGGTAAAADNGGGDAAATADNGGAANNTAGGSGDKVVLNFLHKYVQPDQAPTFEALVKEYMEQNPHVEVRIETTTDDEIKDKLRVALGSGAIPDIYQTWSGEYAKKFIRAGAALDLTPYMEQDAEWKESFIPAALGAYTVDDKIWATPTRFDAEVFIYKTSVFEQYGLSEPKTWDELKEICATLKADDVVPFVLGNGLPWDAPHWFGALWSQCVPYEILEDQDHNNSTVQLTDPGYVKALDYFQELMDLGYFSDNINSTDHNMALETFYAGAGAMMYVELVEFNDINRGMDGAFGFFPMPSLGEAGSDDRIFGGPEGLMVYAKTGQPDEAVNFLKSITSRSAEERKVSEAGHTSSVIGAVNSDNSPQQLVDAMDTVLSFNGMSEWSDCALEARIVDAMLKYGQDFVAGTITSQQYMDELIAIANVVREEYASEA